jgi:hypothetical protein
MLQAGESAEGKQLMGLWKMTGFQDIPKDYPEQLKESLKAYPPPAPAGSNK